MQKTLDFPETKDLIESRIVLLNKQIFYLKKERVRIGESILILEKARDEQRERLKTFEKGDHDVFMPEQHKGVKRK